MTYTTRTGWAIIALCMMISSAFGQDDRWSLEVVGGWGGPVKAVQVAEASQLAYVAAGQRLVILDISNKAEPSEIGAVNLLSSVEDLKVRDGYAYVATSFEPYRFCVVDVSDPTSPQLVWYDPVRPPAFGGCRPGDHPREVDLYRNVAYVRDRGGETVSFDISDPRNVQFLAYSFGLCFGPSWEVLAGPNQIEIIGDHMYMGTTADLHGFDAVALRIYDLRRAPASLVGSVQFDGNDRTPQIVVDGSLAYVTTRSTSTGDRHFYIVDLSILSTPTIQGTYAGLGLSPTQFAVHGGYAYVPHSSPNDITIIDVSDPQSPSVAGVYHPRAGMLGVTVSGGYAYLMDKGEGLLFLDLADPVAPVREGHYHSPAAPRQLAKAGDRLYVSDFYNGFSILDVSEPASPVFLGAYQSHNGPAAGGGPARGIHGIAAHGSMVYLVSAAAAGSIEAVDVSDPAKPSLAGILDEGLVRPNAVAISQVAGPPARVVVHLLEPRGFVNVDVTDPMAMSVMGSIPLSNGGAPNSMIFHDATRVVFGARDSNLVAADMSDPSSPGLVYNGSPNPATDAAIDGDRLYAGSFTPTFPGFLILDVSDPANPVTLGQHSGYGFYTRSIDVQGGRAYLVSTNEVPPPTFDLDFLNVYDVRNPAAPVLLAKALGVTSESGVVGELLAEEPFIYEAGGETAGQVNGLVIFDSRCAADCDQASGAGVLDIFDFLCFQDAFVAMDGYADCDENGEFDVFDFLCFQDAFTLGCP